MGYDVAMTLPALSLIITNNPYLDPGHITLQVDALNRQTSRDFQVFYLNQDRSADGLAAALRQARYPFRIVQIPFPWLGDTVCWDLVSVFGQVLDQPVHGPYMSYLHQECLPAPDFVASLLGGIAASEQVHGQDVIYRLNQLRCEQTLAQLGALWPQELAQAQPISWIARRPYQPSYRFAPRPWEEDAFALPLALLRRQRLFSCVSFPLFFQDLFDIFHQLPQLPGWARVPVIHLGEPIIWHLNHPRDFREYRRGFLAQVRQHPQLFAHLALYELAGEAFDYVEDFAAGERIVPAHLHRFVSYMRYSERGTVTLWARALAAAAGA